MTFSQTVAIAAVSTRVFGPCAVPRAAAVAALKVTGDDAALAFSLHTQVPRTPADLDRWIDPLIADNPLLIGYRLGRISRLLTEAGYGRRLIAGFSAQGRHELLDVVRGRPVPLSVAAGLCGVAAVDEDALLPFAPIAPHVAADLALVNAVASWIVHVRRGGHGTSTPAAAAALTQLSEALHTGAAPLPLIAATVAAVQ
ncbi:MAG: hypothetical protein Q8807_03320 ['Waltheria sp.' little leaf phytoplasma]|nr:hypothetical protein ['Waltheria sp.' little leaf phytoplasma]